MEFLVLFVAFIVGWILRGAITIQYKPVPRRIGTLDDLDDTTLFDFAVRQFNVQELDLWNRLVNQTVTDQSFDEFKQTRKFDYKLRGLLLREIKEDFELKKKVAIEQSQ